MSHPDPVLARLAALPVPEPDRTRAETTRAQALARLRPRPLHPAWALLVLGSVCGYLGSALYFTARLF